MEQKPDYYQILGVLPNSEDVVIRGAYRALMQKYHPDAFGGDAEEAARRTRELNEAYGVLRDPEARARYDAERAAAVSEHGVTAPLPLQPAPGQTEKSVADGTAQPPQANTLAATAYKARHALITAGYLAAVLLIFLVARAALSNRHPASRPVTSTEIAIADSKPPPAPPQASPRPTSAPIKPKLAATQPPENPPPTSATPVKREAPSLPQPLPVQPPSSKPASVSASTRIAPSMKDGPATQRATTPQEMKAVDNTGTAGHHSTKPPLATQHYAPLRRHLHRLARANEYGRGYDAVHNADRDESDEATTRWLNGKSAISRPRWRPYKTWQRYRAQN